MKKGFVILMGCFLALAGCGQNGSEFLGTWLSAKQTKSTMIIERNGDEFIVRREIPQMIGGPTKDSYPATVQDGVLHMNVGIGVIDFAIDKSSGHLLGGGTDYLRKQ